MHFDPESNVVDVHVGNLRRKQTPATGEPLLATVRGKSFSLRRRGDSDEALLSPWASSAPRFSATVLRPHRPRF